MSSAYSTINNYADLPVYSPDVNFVIQGLQYKQQKYDHNKEKLQSFYDELSMVDLAKEEDKEYFEQRLDKVREIANKYMSGDLSRSSVVNSVMRNLNQVLDKDVLTAVSSTKILRAEQKAWQELKEGKDGDKLYNEANYQFAMQNAQQWLNDGKAGTKYNGGGGVIHYDDVAGRVIKELPDMVKSINDKWVETVPGSGMFMDVVTKEAVPRDKVEAAIDAVIGERGLRQLQIDAWSKYRNVDDKALVSAYDRMVIPKITQASETITNLDNLIAKEKDPSLKAAYQKSRDRWTKEKVNLENRTSDKVLGSSGKEALYTTLHIQQFKDNFLNVYSKDERIVDRKIDQNDLQTKKMQFEIEKFEYTKQKDAAKSSGEGGTTPPEVLPGSNLDLSELEGYGSLESNLQVWTNRGYEALNNFKETFGNKFSATDLVELAAKMPESFSDEGGTFEVDLGGRKFTFDLTKPENRVALENFRSYTIGTDPSLQEARAILKNSANEALEQLVYTDVELNLSEDNLPNFGFKLVDNGSGGFVVEADANANKTYHDLVVKEKVYKYKFNQGLYAAAKPLTQAERKTLEAYARLHFIADPELSSAQKRESYIGFRQDMYDIVGREGFKLMPQNLKSVVDYALNLRYIDGESGDFYKGGADGHVYVKKKNTREWVKSADPTSEEKLNRARSEGNVAGNWGWDKSSMSHLGVDMQKIKRVMDESVERVVEKSAANMSQRSGIIGAGSELHNRLGTLMGLDSKNTTPITVYREVVDGKPTGNYKAFNRYKKTDKGATTVESGDLVTIDAEQAQSIGLNFAEQDVTPYNALFSDAPAKSIGSSRLSVERKSYENFAMKGVPDALDITKREVKKSLADNYAAGGSEVINMLFNNYDRGAYEFKLEPIKGSYYVTMYEGASPLHSVPYLGKDGKPAQLISVEEVVQVEFEDATRMKSDVFMDFIDTQVLTRLANSRIKDFIPQ